MATWSTENPLWNWLISTGISIICFLISSAMYLRERRNRQRSHRVVPCKYLSASSYLCIILGPITTFLDILVYFPVFCHIYYILNPPTGMLQTAAMEFYQLSRLHYCFSRNRVHAHNSYPNWVFVVLFVVLLIWFFSVIITSYSWWPTECRIRSEGTAVTRGIELFVNRFWTSIIMSLYVVLEVTTVLLYWCKVRSLRKCQIHSQNEDVGKERVVHDRIQSEHFAQSTHFDIFLFVHLLVDECAVRNC